MEKEQERERFCVWQIVDIGRRPDEVIEDDLRVESFEFVLMLLRDSFFSTTFARAITFC